MIGANTGAQSVTGLVCTELLNEKGDWEGGGQLIETMGINARLHWIPEAGREAFIVLNHNLQDFDRNNRFNSASADLALKFNYTFRF